MFRIAPWYLSRQLYIVRPMTIARQLARFAADFGGPGARGVVGELRHREQVNRGAAERPLSNAEVEAKFMDNARLGGDAARAQRIREAVLALEESSAQGLEEALVG
jgi:hypothetical protein